MYEEIFCASMVSLRIVCGDWFVLEAIEDIIEMSSESGLYLASSLSNILNTTDFACDTVDKVGTATGDIFHSGKSLLGVCTGNGATFI